MADLICSLILSAFAITVATGYGVLAILPARSRNQRLDGHGGVMLGRGIMEVAYKLFAPLVSLLYKAHVTPNMVTAFSLVPALISAFLIAQGHFGVGALLATGSGFCDMFDGMLARRYNSTSDVGELFDAAVDRYVEYLLLAGLASFMVSYATAKAEALGVEPPKGAMRRAERAVYVIFGCGLAPLWQLVVPGSPSYATLSLGRELPVELAMAVVAVVANVSAVRRMLRIAEIIRAKKLAA
jgi:CDP-diacylglycerol--glycerol-3-phosphate 3-phosphatidyltransferase